jgi:hypothetical protein
MRTPARALGWEFGRCYRGGFFAIAAYFAFVAAFRLAMRARGQTVELDDAQMALAITIPLTAAFIYLLAVFSFGLTGDLGARQSMFPPRLFTLPMTTSELAAWPMLYGCAAAVALWAAERVLGLWPSDVHVPIVWPALLAASLLAWTQALTWMPYPLRGLRVAVTILWLATIDTIVILAMHFKAPESVMLVLLAPHVPLAYVVARYAIARGRRGDVPGRRDARGMSGRRVRGSRPQKTVPFASAGGALAWFEWHRHGRTLPSLVAILLPFEVALLFVFRATPELVMDTLFGILATPPFMAGFVAIAASRTNLQGFTGTRPISSGELAAATMKVAIWSTAATWVLVCSAMPLGLFASGTLPLVVARVRDVQHVLGTPRTVALACLICAGLVIWTWKRLVQSLYLGFTGREWLSKAYALLTLSCLALTGPLLWLAGDRRVVSTVWDSLPWILFGFVALKMIAAAVIAPKLFRSRLISDRVLVTAAASWSAAVLALYALFAWFVDTPYVPHYVLMLLATLAIPLARVSAAPLALAANRHR